MHTPIETHEALHTIQRIDRDILTALKRECPGGVTDNHARYLVDEYYAIQEGRVRNGNRVQGLLRDAEKAGNEPEPFSALSGLANLYAVGEQNISRLLNWYVQDHPMRWFFEATCGIGHILAAGLLAHIDIARCPTVGHIERFAGLDPTQSWVGKDDAAKILRDAPGETIEERLASACLELGRTYPLLLQRVCTDPNGKPRKLTVDNAVKALARKPWNGSLKTTCWKIGDSFVKQSHRPTSFYSQLYVQRKAEEWRKNLAGELQDAATASMARKKYGKQTQAHAWYTGQCSAVKAAECLAAGTAPTPSDCQTDDPSNFPMLSPAHIDARARRYAVKIFLSHLHECWYRQHHGEDPPKPFAIAIQGHAHYIPPPQLATAAKQAA